MLVSQRTIKDSLGQANLVVILSGSESKGLVFSAPAAFTKPVVVRGSRSRVYYPSEISETIIRRRSRWRSPERKTAERGNWA